MGDVRDYGVTEKAMRGADLVFHLAAQGSGNDFGLKPSRRLFGQRTGDVECSRGRPATTTDARRLVYLDKQSVRRVQAR